MGLTPDRDRYKPDSNRWACSLAAWENLQLPVRWAELLTHWVDPQDPGAAWLQAHRLESGLYRSRSGVNPKVLQPL